MFLRKIGMYALMAGALFSSCGEQQEEENSGDGVVGKSYVSSVDLPKSGGAYTSGAAIPFKITFSDGGKTLVKLDVMLDDKNIFTSAEQKKEFLFNHSSDTLTLGIHKVTVAAELTDGNVETVEYEWMLLASQAPEAFTYKVNSKFPHDRTAYTQGLVFENGMMYEGTGENGKSQLRLWDFKKNNIVRSIKLDDTYFGEGIAVLGDKIYQLTYTTRKGFVYDKQSFKLLREFSYTTQGWGLTHDGTSLIMSDGSSFLYFYDPETFTLKYKRMVVDNLSDIGMLNELEYINGEVWANIYQTDFIVRIDPKTGRVIAKIDLTGLLTDADKAERVDVLNGIAYDATTQKIYVTGKWWPWMFDITPVPLPVAAQS